jgi:ABC-type dipeptide/oligopeptide/nickel transport system permease subunit
MPFPAAGPALEPATDARGRAALHRLVASRLGLLGAVLTLAFAGLGTGGAVILLVPGLRHLSDTQNLAATLVPPGAHGHLFGTDSLGRDLFSRLLASIGVSLLVGVVVTIATVTIGLIVGGAAGYFGGRRETTITGIIDLTWSFPLILVAVIAAGTIGKGLTALVLGVPSSHGPASHVSSGRRSRLCASGNSSRLRACWACRTRASSSRMSCPTWPAR